LYRLIFSPTTGRIIPEIIIISSDVLISIFPKPAVPGENILGVNQTRCPPEIGEEGNFARGRIPINVIAPKTVRLAVITGL
jgi:hypothetical protein